MTRFWVALARFTAKRAGGRFMRTIKVDHAANLGEIEDWFDLPHITLRPSEARDASW